MTAEVLLTHHSMTSSLSKAFDPPLPANMNPAVMDPPGSASSNRDDHLRGRRRNRESSNGGPVASGQGADESHGGGGDTPSSRKRRRSRKGLDKKFECPHEGCGKSYSRAEHLYRHQLNHNPKQIYHCDFPDCHRSFVRQDLCARHRERHTARGSQLLRKDTFIPAANPIPAPVLTIKGHAASRTADPSILQPGDVAFAGANRLAATGSSNTIGLDKTVNVISPTSAVPSSSMFGSDASPTMDRNFNSPASESSSVMKPVGTLHRSASDESYRRQESFGPMERNSPHARNVAAYNALQRHGSFGAQEVPHASSVPVGGAYPRPALQTQQPLTTAKMQQLNLNSPYGVPPPQTFSTSHQQPRYPVPSSASYQAHQTFPPFPALPPPGYATMSQAPPARDSEHGYVTASQSNPDTIMTTTSDPSLLDSIAPSYAMPIFGGEGYSRSPFAMAEDFTTWLFDQNHTSGASPIGLHRVSSANMMPAASVGMQTPYFHYDHAAPTGYYSQPTPPHHPMAVSSILDSSHRPGYAMSEEKRSKILDLIECRFNESDHVPVKRKRDFLGDGDQDGEPQVLSMGMMTAYVNSYWIHFHPQMPILHWPTFQADTCPDLLLLAMMSLGASCLEKSNGPDMTEACADLANFLAWHVRWEIFMDADFRPPAKLWVFQALLLLEIFEKMYSIRPLHERAHIHHATTLTLMRRGSSLIGRSALDSPPSLKDGRRGSAPNGSGNSGSSTPDERWQQWITNEATRRVAFAAFVIDSTHATMFGHSAVLVAHEMRLPLPCDEALWNAPSGADVSRIEGNLKMNGITPIPFLDGLRKMMSCQPVRTNAFGRTILMAGLLSVSWHMIQRDLQVSSLGVSQALGGKDKWRGALTRAFDFWKLDFDTFLVKSSEASSAHNPYNSASHEDMAAECRTVLHPLAHMAMHVDIVDCQIFAGASRLLGRSITQQDYAGAQRRMKENWAPSARARDAAFYALRFLSEVLMPARPTRRSSVAQPGPGFEYSACEDWLLNRPWVLYFASLVVWCYGFALDGPLRPPYMLDTHDQRVADMQSFLRRVGGVPSPDDLAHVPDRNGCLGVLLLLRDNFRNTRWELLHEASNLLTKCIDMSMIPAA